MQEQNKENVNAQRRQSFAAPKVGAGAALKTVPGRPLRARVAAASDAAAMPAKKAPKGAAKPMTFAKPGCSNAGCSAAACSKAVCSNGGGTAEHESAADERQRALNELEAVIAARDEDEAPGATLDDFPAVPKDLNPGQAEFMPNLLESEERVRAIRGAALEEEIMESISLEGAVALAAVKENWREVDQSACEKAMDVCNLSNRKTAKSPLILPCQEHGGCGPIAICGTFLVTSVMNKESKGTLTAENNPTVQAASYCEGYLVPGMDEHLRLNLMPTCPPEYTAVPTPADYGTFRPATRELLAGLCEGGVQVITAIAYPYPYPYPYPYTYT